MAINNPLEHADVHAESDDTGAEEGEQWGNMLSCWASDTFHFGRRCQHVLLLVRSFVCLSHSHLLYVNGGCEEYLRSSWRHGTSVCRRCKYGGLPEH